MKSYQIEKEINKILQLYAVSLINNDPLHIRFSNEKLNEFVKEFIQDEFIYGRADAVQKLLSYLKTER
jgi:hypothetical protein